MNRLDYFGIHEVDVSNAYDQAMECMEKLDCECWDFEENVIERCKESFDWEDPTNSFIKNIYEEVQAVCHKYDVTYDVNDWDSHLYIGSIRVEEWDRIFDHLLHM